MNWDTFVKFTNHVNANEKMNKLNIYLSIIFDSLKYNISILEYFQFNFFKKENNDKIKWAGTGYMYEYQLKMNPLDKRDILDDKTKFYKSYKDYFIHLVADLNDLKKNEDLAQKILNNESKKLVFKVADGKCGVEVEIKNTNEFSVSSLIEFLDKSKFDLVEEYIIQHSELNKLSPSAVNTVRIFTQLNAENEVEILGCRQRISVNSSVDNMAAGNLAAPIDEQTGIITSAGVYSDITKNEEKIHPITKVSIIGFQVPFWNETLSLVKNAAKLHPQNKSIGWDVVITDRGPGLIEGNHDWCKLLWQLPVKKGLKHLLKVPSSV
jgi:hypothetical protein